MPRPNPHRSIASEQSLARRIAYERESRGMSYDGLALRMSKAGCPINASALYKIEKADPPRRITVDELVALSRVFGVPIADLLEPPERLLSKELLGLLRDMANAADDTLRANDAYKASMARLGDFVLAHPETMEQLEQTGISISDLVEMLRQIDEEEDARYAERLQRLSGAKNG